MAADRPRVHPRVARRRSADQLVQRHPVGARQRQQQLEGRPASAGLEPRQRARRDARRRRQLGRASGRAPGAAPAAADRPPSGPRRARPPCRASCHSGNRAWRSGTGWPTLDAEVVTVTRDDVRRGGGRRRRRRAERGADARAGPAAGAGGRRGRAAQRPGRPGARLPGPGGHAAGRAARRSAARRSRRTAASVVTADAVVARSPTATASSSSWRRRPGAQPGGCSSRPGWSTSCPTCPGVAERWGRDVLHCPYCHGWEVRDQAIGVLATGPLAVHQALLFRQWSRRRDAVPAHRAARRPTTQAEQLAARDIAVVTGEVDRAGGGRRPAARRPAGRRTDRRPATPWWWRRASPHAARC